jgi:hypothetical protein
MTKKHFRRAAEMVRGILEGDWTHEPPSWFNGKVYGQPGYEAGDAYYDASPNDAGANNLTRAVQTAEALILLFRQSNDRFDEQKFLEACGLVEKVKRGKRA